MNSNGKRARNLGIVMPTRISSYVLVPISAESCLRLGKLMPSRADSGLPVPSWTISGCSVRVGPGQYKKAHNFFGRICNVGLQAKACSLHYWGCLFAPMALNVRVRAKCLNGSQPSLQKEGPTPDSQNPQNKPNRYNKDVES